MIVYLASPIRPKGDQTLRGNIDNAKKIALELWSKGYTVFCPAANTDLPSEAAHALDKPAQFWLDADLEILAFCDAMVLIPGWHDSEGCMGELRFAYRHDIPIYFYPELPEVAQ